MPLARTDIPTNTLVLSDIPFYELFIVRRTESGGLPNKDFVCMRMPSQADGIYTSAILMYDADTGQAGWNPLNENGRMSDRWEYRFIRYLEPEEGITLRGSGVEPE